MQSRKFNITGACNPRLHYMVDLGSRLQQIDEMLDGSTYFSVVKPRQSGKTTLMFSLAEYLNEKYFVVMIDFQMIGTNEFQDESSFSKAFMRNFLRSLKSNYEYGSHISKEFLSKISEKEISSFGILFETLSDICKKADKPVLLMIDETDTALRLPIFFDFLAQIRASYLYRDTTPAFYSVILFGTKELNDSQNDELDLDSRKLYGPWNIFTTFPIDMSFSAKDIAGMLKEYKSDHKTRMNVSEMSKAIFEVTSGFPFLVSKICQIIDETTEWSAAGLIEAEKILGNEIQLEIEKAPERLEENPALKEILKTILFHAITN